MCREEKHDSAISKSSGSVGVTKKWRQPPVRKVIKETRDGVFIPVMRTHIGSAHFRLQMGNMTSILEAMQINLQPQKNIPDTCCTKTPFPPFTRHSHFIQRLRRILEYCAKKRRSRLHFLIATVLSKPLLIY